MIGGRRRDALRRELSASAQAPYAAHVSPQVIRTTYGDYLQAFRLGGGSFQTADDAQMNGWHERLNILWRNLASPQVALWTHVVRRRKDADVPATGADGPPRRGHCFAAQLESKYRAGLRTQHLMVNDLYLAIVHRPAAHRGAHRLARMLSTGAGDTREEDTADALDASQKLAQVLLASLARYEPEPLGLYRSGSAWCSSLMAYLGLLLNGEKRRFFLPRQPLAQVLMENRVLFGHETLEYRTASATRYGAMLGIKEYPTPTIVGMYDRLLSAPFPFVLTQSFVFLSKAAGQALLQRQQHRMANAGDFAVSQAAELTAALDALTSNEFVMGDHHLSLQVLSDFADAAGLDATRQLKSLNDRVAFARTILADTGMIVAREDLGLEAAFWAQLPGCFAMRPRKAPITSRNFAAMAPFHNFPSGRARGNHWGDALTTLTTSARSAYHFSLHASDPADPDGGARKDTGHTLICGPTGSGKTVFIGFLIAMLSRQQVTQVIFDKDRGLEILVRALGGEYRTLRNGRSTGLNPLQLPPTPTNLEFLKTWLYTLCWGADAAEAGRSERTGHQQDLEQALRGTLALERGERRMSRLVEFLDSTADNGPHQRLCRWCECARGDYAWAFDGPQDLILPLMDGHAIVGFDVTEFLDNAVLRAPIALYLFHLVRQLLDGRRLVCWMDEFWRLVADPAFESFAKDGPKTWRKLNGVMCLATQSASDVLQSPISRTLVEQTPTKVFFPNADADFKEYTQGFGLTLREFQLVRERLEPGSRSFLVKQAHHSVVCELDLKGFDAELAVISGRADALRRVTALIEETGPDPAHWLPRFLPNS